MTLNAATVDDDNRVQVPTADFYEWFGHRRETNAYEVEQVALDRLDGWSFDRVTGNLGHRSGKFYSIQGLEVHTDNRHIGQWQQPIIVQPEIGILGILIKRFEGVPHCLMQAKMEPGNINLLQLSPTVQATRSNYTRVHQGSPVPYLDYFTTPRRSRAVVDALQSEQGAWFLHKRNRNIVVETTDDVEPHPDFCWLTLPQLHDLLLEDNLINMDARSVLSGLPLAAPSHRPELLREDSYRGALARSFVAGGRVRHDLPDVLSWLTELKARHSLRQTLVPLNTVGGWYRDEEAIRHEDGRYFSVIGTDVHATNREVARWSQPLLKPSGRGVLAFITKLIDDVLHVLVQARTEAGTQDVLEIAPTVHCAPVNLGGDVPRSPFLDYVLHAPASQIRHDGLHSEEGGRFYHAENRYMVVEAGDDFPLDVPEDFLWLTARQITDLVPYANHLNVEARSLLVTLHTLWRDQS